ncbi:MAG: YihY family inner membrane protein [Gammaproteobacteria bacterium]|nr:YihY family inner membrane protein [Gammaproteobacteria bacterium]MCW8909912.1 YihY family inner membrane protein [Gammaproteobacteria bacterium]MCW9003883.1 YihY family inner membrane protein [Gammaproteobacteria bacterium]MCW9055172.1 YihY family inner membrane protein [Gammaproteobacteria bacterium]
MSFIIRSKYWYERLVFILGDDFGYFAASLSFYTIFSFIPVLWILFYVLSQFEAFASYYLAIKAFIVMNLVPAHSEMISQYLDSFLENTRRMGVMGFVYTAIASVMFYKNYQYIVNKIFYVPNNSLWRALRTYFVLALLMPVTLGMSFYLSDYLQRVAGEYGEMFGLLTLLSYLLVWFLFFVVFKVSPNMKVNIRVALTSSFIVSLVWQIAKMLFVYYVMMNQTYATLYGSFSILLLVLLWVYLSWFMLLHGLRLCYFMQCHH